MSIGSIAGGLLSAYGAYRSSKANQAGIDRQIAESRRQAKEAKDAAKFRQVGFRSNLGNFTTSVDDAGNLTDVGFMLDPRFQDRADTFARLGEDMLGNLVTDPTEAAERDIARLEELQAPGRAQAQERMFSDLAAKGLTGIGVDMGTGAQVNPYAAAFSESVEQQQRRNVIDSYDRARKQMAEDLAFTESLFGSEQDIYNLGRNELMFGLGLANDERDARLRAAGVDRQIGSNIADLQGQRGNVAAGRTEALLASLGRLGGQAYDDWQEGLFSNSSSSMGTTPTDRINQRNNFGYGFTLAT